MKSILRRVSALLLASTLSISFVGCLSADGESRPKTSADQAYDEMGQTEMGAYSRFKDINVQSSYLGMDMTLSTIPI